MNENTTAPAAEGTTDLVSIILPYYNGSRFLKEALESIKSQTFKRFECLLVDDGSPDKKESDFAKEAVASLGDDRFRYVLKPNGGLSDARNHGIAIARGAYIAFIDQDDYWKPEKLAKQMQVMAAHEEVGFVFTDADVLFPRGQAGRRKRPSGFDVSTTGFVKDSYRRMLRENFVPCASVLFKKSLAEKAGPSKKAFAMCPDYELFIRMARAGDFYYVDEPLFVYRIHEANTTRRTERLLSEILWVLFDSPLSSFRDKAAATKNFAQSLLSLIRLWVRKLRG